MAQKGSDAKTVLVVSAIAGVILLVIFILTRGKNDQGPNVSAEEASAAAVAAEKRVDERVALANTKDQKFGKDMVVDERGNILGVKNNLVNLPENMTLGSVEGEAPKKPDYDVNVAKIDNSIDYSGLEKYAPGSYQVRSESLVVPEYKSAGEAEASKKGIEVAQMFRQFRNVSMLVYSETEGIAPERKRDRALIGGSPRGDGDQRGGGNGGDGIGFDVDNYIDKVLNRVDSLSVGNSAPAISADGGPRFGALSRPLVSRVGQLSDMRIGGQPEIVVPEGKFIEGATVNAIETSFHDNPVQVIVTRDFVDRTGKYVLVPRGTKILGLAFRIENFQAQRMFISFHRALFPDGRSAYFPERALPEAFSPAGILGSSANVNMHWWRKFGNAIALGVLEGGLYVAAGGEKRTDPMGGTTMSAETMGAQAVADQLKRVADNMMQYYSNFAPTATVKVGTRIKVYLSEDMILSAYQVYK